MITPLLAALTTLAVHLDGVHLGSARVAAPAEPEPEEPYVPGGVVEAPPVTPGTTELAGQGQFAAAAAALEAESPDATELELAAGGVLSTGNAFASSITGQGRFRVRRGKHQFAAQAAGNYGYGTVQRRTTEYLYRFDDEGNPIAVPQESSVEEPDVTIANVQGMLRYDAFFAEHWSAFAMATARRDRFQGLDARLNLDPGVAFHVLVEEHHRLWFEAGYDFQYDRRREAVQFETRPVEPAQQDPDDPSRALTERVRVADPTLVNHAARLFAGYNNSLSERVTLDTGVEYLQSFLVARRFRLNWVTALGINLAGRLGVAVTFTLRYENQPLPSIQKLDTITAILLTLRFV